MVLSTVGNVGTKLVVDFEQYKPMIDNSSKNEGELILMKEYERYEKQKKSFINN